MMEPVSKYTKLKIIAGYALLFLLSILSILAIYRQITRLTLADADTNTSRKLFLTGNTITGLYQAEALSNAFVQTGSQSYFDKYLQILEEVENNIDTLKSLTTNLPQQLRIDSIHLLLEKKVKNLRKLVQVKQSLVPDDFYNKAIASITSGKDSLPDTPGIRKEVITTLDSTYIKSEKKRRWRLFSRNEPDSVLQITVSHHTIIDSTRAAALQNTDSVIHMLESVRQELQQHSENVTRQINRQEYALINQSTYITDQLKKVLGEYEKEEIHNSLYKIEQREKVVNTTTRIIAWIAVAAVLLILFFIFFILRDLSRSQRYRRELETANQYTARLLKSREKMILTVTHDIKSPLSSVLGYIELLNNTAIDERQRYYLQNMQGSSEHILKLVGNLLDLSRLENHKMTVEEIGFNPAQLFAEIAGNFMPLAQAKHLILTNKFGEDLNRNYKGDALRIRQIITNILSNAVKYTAQGSIHFSAVSSTDDRQMIISICDTGSGMTAEEQKMIFEEFTRLKSHATIEGTGLGLTITLKLIQLLGGRLEVKSEPGKGSRFTLFLPLKPATPSPEPSSPAEPAPGLPAVRSLRILLVDDDPLQLAMTGGMLENKGILTETTLHPGEVTGKLRDTSFDLVISDIQMPEMSGFELVADIRRQPEKAGGKIPVIALSADAGKTEKEYLEAGFTAYLPKPFTSADLMEVITRLTGFAPARSMDHHPAEAVTDSDGYTLKNIRLFTDNDPAALRTIVASFISTTREHIILLEKYIQEEDCENIARLAHKMLPLFRQLEAIPLVEKLRQLERHTQIPLSVSEMTALTRQVIAGTEELLGKLENHPME